MTGRALRTRSIAKPWGRDTLPALFAAPDGERIGEIWFEPPPEMPGLLVKYLFTSENLSVQVHPSDAAAPHGACGKDECWLIVRADPGARLAVGFTRPVSRDEMRAAALDGSIEALLDWREVTPGDFFYLPAGTVHAIGAGIALIEIQQNSDVTYRLYDYGRPRELHLDQAVAIAEGAPHDPVLRRAVPAHGAEALVEGPHFRLDRLDGQPNEEVRARYGERPVLVIPLDASVEYGGAPVEPGECGLANSLAHVRFAAGGRALVAQPV